MIRIDSDNNQDDDDDDNGGSDLYDILFEIVLSISFLSIAT